MKHVLHIWMLGALVAGLVMAHPVSAQQNGCFADYKAKRSVSGNLELHYGVIELGARACQSPRRAEQAVSRRIAPDGWTLLRIVSTFGRNGLQQRQDNAGPYFLRY
ncbi:hypothetical protein [Neptunicoccus cionae]|uniref:Uncharacterized protein n=1 Tax=Neptunicoccus cionae TaxID=2035344 RepID=A0A916QX14_9RHOB|nr:hypothetical protein [Amylibacter cionae]GGA17860.1 hypothetical protein GCM10011498_18100 [Amylibacter cionae]